MTLALSCHITGIADVEFKPTKTKDGQDGWFVKCPRYDSATECQSKIGIFCNSGFNIVGYNDTGLGIDYIITCKSL